MPNKYNSCAIGRKDGVSIDEFVVSELSLIFSVCVHYDDFGIAVSIGVENNLCAIRRKGGVRVNRLIIGQFCEVASIAINGANLTGNAEGSYSIGGKGNVCAVGRECWTVIVGLGLG